MEFFRKLLESDFMPHGHCYFWKPEILWMTVGGDALTAAAYYSIPLMLFYFAKTRRDLAHKYVFFLFAAFIFLCGTTHVLDIWTAWIPTYRLASVVKLITGLVSIATAIVLYKSLPALLAIPSTLQLAATNQQLKNEILEKEKIQEELNQAKNLLEAHVLERTEQLSHANRELEKEIEQRKKAQKELIRKNNELVHINADLDSFVYCASHDLKSPISNMEGLLMALKEEQASPNGDEGPILELLETSVQRLNRTIADLSDVSKIQRRSDEEIFEEIELETLLNDVLEGIRNVVESSEAEVVSDFTAQPVISFVPQHLKSILQNLLTNAIKYKSPDRKPIISVKTSETDSHIILTVQDNGIGINLNRHGEKIFSLFKRLHDHVAGSGVGLYVIKRIMENYDGKIEVESELNEGTSFHIYFRKRSVEP